MTVPPDTPTTGTHQRIVAARLPWARHSLNLTVRQLLIVPLILVFIVVFAWFMERNSWLTLLAAPAFMLMLIVMFVTLVRTFRSRLELFDRETAKLAAKGVPAYAMSDRGIATEPLVGEAFVEAERTRRGIHLWTPEVWPWEAFHTACRKEGVVPPMTLFDSRLQAALDAIERPSVGMEPESILSSGLMQRKWLLIFGLLMLPILLIMLFEGRSAFPLYFVGYLVLMSVLSLPSLRDRLRAWRFDDGNIVVGQGYLIDRGQRCWTVDDSTMVIQQREAGGSMYLMFLGPAGELKLTFIDPDDPDFIVLWQRWNHPDPRPELAGTGTASA